jgi:glycosyltransferase involved in cell wall biosynthesis
MKIYYCNSFLEGCYYVRCLIPMREGGWDGDKTSMRTLRIQPEMQAKGVLDADVVVFHRPNDSRCMQIADMLRAQGKKIVMDNDDTYKGLDAQRLGATFKMVDKAIDDFGKQADLITCSTEFLAEEYRKLNKNVVVLPNCIEPDDWPEPERNETDVVRIGITGSVGLNSDTDEFKWALDILSKRKDVRLVLFSLPPKNETTKDMVQKLYKQEYAYWESLNVEWQPFVMMEDYMDTLNSLKLDLMVIPRKDDYFNRCKSNIKFLEASMLEIPVIAQGFADGKSPYQGDEDSQYMRIVTDNSKWVDELEPLIQDKKLRRNMGTKAKEYVLNNYQIKDKIFLWENAYKGLLNV